MNCSSLYYDVLYNQGHVLPDKSTLLFVGQSGYFTTVCLHYDVMSLKLVLKCRGHVLLNESTLLNGCFTNVCLGYDVLSKT